MIFLLTNDLPLIESCSRVFKNREDVNPLNNASRLISSHPNDVLIADLNNCDEKDLSNLDCTTIALVSVPNYEQALRLLQLGVKGYGNRFMQAQNLLQAVQSARAGQVWLPPAIMGQMIRSLNAYPAQSKVLKASEPLSRREAEVCQWIINGLTNKEISEEMFISVRTVKAHLTSIFKKTRCRDRVELVLKMR